MVRTRVAPSPTGFPHLGLVYQALFNYVLTHTYGGSFVLRIEDTDRTRFVEGAEDVIYDSLNWVGLIPDEGPKEGGEYGPYRQSERLSLYKKYADQLIESGNAYRCFCSKERLEEMRKSQEAKHQAPMYDKTCRNLSKEEVANNMDEELSFVVRMKIPQNQKIVVKDAIVGDVEFDSNQIDDQVILKSDGYPTYHLAVVVDDYSMKITHVFRGTEWLPSYPKHVLLWEYLGLKEEMPVFIHLPVLLNSNEPGKLSKRHAHTSVKYYQEEGYLPEAVLNYLANIVWNHPEGKEIFPLMDFGKAMQIDPLHFDIKSNGVRFNLEKLRWMNGEYIRNLELNVLIEKLNEFFKGDKEVIEVLESSNGQKLVELARSRMKTLKEFKDLVINQRIKLTTEEKEIAKTLHLQLNNLQEWNKERILGVIRNVLNEKKIKGNVLYKIFTGREQGLPLPEAMEILGKGKTLERII